MPPAWSDEWVAALDAAARADARLQAASVGRHVVIGQEVVDGARRIRWHVVLDDGSVRVRPGPADGPDVTFSQDAEVATAVASGRLAARTAFALGRIRVGGDVGVLLELAPALAGLGDVFASVRASSDARPSAATGDPPVPASAPAATAPAPSTPRSGAPGAPSLHA